MGDQYPEHPEETLCSWSCLRGRELRAGLGAPTVELLRVTITGQPAKAGLVPDQESGPGALAHPRLPNWSGTQALCKVPRSLCNPSRTCPLSSAVQTRTHNRHWNTQTGHGPHPRNLNKNERIYQGTQPWGSKFLGAGTPCLRKVYFSP